MRPVALFLLLLIFNQCVIDRTYASTGQRTTLRNAPLPAQMREDLVKTMAEEIGQDVDGMSKSESQKMAQISAPRSGVDLPKEAHSTWVSS